MGKPFKLSPKVIIRDEEDRCLILKRSGRCRHFPGKWEFPGGKMESGEDFEAALMREVNEETGLDISLDRVAGAVGWELPGLNVAVLIMEARKEAGTVTLSDEHTDFDWVTPEDLPGADMCDSLLSFVKNYAGQRPGGGDGGEKK